MKKTPLLNSHLSRVIAEMGHLDRLVIADAGLPIPKESDRIDLALTKGIPGFLETLEAVRTELEIESVIVAEELQTAGTDSKTLFAAIQGVLGEIPIQSVSHEAFKALLPTARVVVRTGEFTPYANIVLVAGVAF
ncbi:MAG: D-ribose pyranase [Desulfosarcinaceae bacterium]|nr:D-ribose pyranase [Desulfosarcinaceae bacterium]